ncbi:S41 family peptidase [Roseomonas gilardii]|uniref:S41 family peptidase n=1 Tax=Roseomonas gilardii TaxID=257708 RepID=UPI0004B6F3DE|nr:S41 family peptidase [Roseomonas gilardii]SUE44314.1 Probable CtpA-like serine protease [Roseomonas gilardii subsp. rosea]
MIETTLQAGFEAIAERHLDPVTPPDLALWALRGLTALEPGFDVESRDGVLRVSLLGRSLAQRATPGTLAEAASALSWLYGAAWGVSPTLRRAGADALLQASFDEVFNHLDPYSRYVSPATADSDRDRRMGTAGLGLQVEGGPRGATVLAVMPDSPAEAAGLQPGDVLLSLNGISMARQAPDRLAALLEGPLGSRARLRIQRGRGHRNIVLRREVVPPQTVRSARQGDALVLRITAFSSDTADQLGEALLMAFDHPASPAPRSLVLDLRGNRGGFLREAIRVVDNILSAGIVARTDGRHPDARRVWHAAGMDLTQGRPIAILVDGRTASSAEIVTAALSDNGRAAVVGSATMGKGLIQILVPLPNEGELSLSWSRILAPDGWPLQSLGVLPALCTSLGADGTTRGLERLAQGDAPMGAVLRRQRQARVPVLPSEITALRGACPPAEGRDGDLQAAVTLLSNPEAYRTATAK